MAEFAGLVPEGLSRDIVPFSYHENPERARQFLQELIDAVPDGKRHVILGYGLCSNSLVGLSSARQELVVPRVHDCIAMFFGSQKRHQQIMDEDARTLFLTKGFIEGEEGKLHLVEYPAYKERYGEEKARIYMSMILKEYRRVMLLDSGSYDLEEYRRIASSFAEEFDLHYLEEKGSDTLFRRMIEGDWNDDFLRFPPGEAITQESFFII